MLLTTVLVSVENSYKAHIGIRVYLSKYNIQSDQITLSNIPSAFPLIVIIDEYGRVTKKMLLKN